MKVLQDSLENFQNHVWSNPPKNTGEILGKTSDEWILEGVQVVLLEAITEAVIVGILKIVFKGISYKIFEEISLGSNSREGYISLEEFSNEF